ncbi:MAG: CapA family protein [Erysipelotrichaceae bacterium]
MKKKIIAIAVLLILIVSAAITLLLTKPKEEPPVIIEEPVDIVEKEEPKEFKASLIMGGDAVIHSSVYTSNCIDGVYDFSYPLEEIKKLVQNYDLAYYNQETILGGKEYGLSNYPEFNSPQEVGDGFVDAGFNLVSLATNHTMDWYNSKGDTLVVSSRNYWLDQYEKNGVISAGSYKSQEDKDNIVIGEVNNITYALLSYTFGTNGIYPSSSQSYLVNYIDKEQIKNDVDKYRDKVDVLMVAMHWGEEYLYSPTSYQQDLALYLADLDVDIVIGNHAHVLEPIEWIDDTLVIYALGNIISGQYFAVQTLTTALCSLDITKTINDDGTSTITMDNVGCHLFYGITNDRWKMVPYSELTDEQLPDHDVYFKFFSEVLRGSVSQETINEVTSIYNPTETYILDDYPSFKNITPFPELKVE